MQSKSWQVLSVWEQTSGYRNVLRYSIGIFYFFPDVRRHVCLVWVPQEHLTMKPEGRREYGYLSTVNRCQCRRTCKQDTAQITKLNIPFGLPWAAALSFQVGAQWQSFNHGRYTINTRSGCFMFPLFLPRKHKPASNACHEVSFCWRPVKTHGDAKHFSVNFSLWL